MNHLSILTVLWIFFTIFYFIAKQTKNAGLVDIGWGIGFVVVSAWVQFNQNKTSGWILFLMILLWGGRLAFHLFKRNVGKPEDYRYAAFRRDWGKNYELRAYFQIFMLQGVLMYGVSVASIFGQQSAALLSLPLLILGVLIYLIGLTIETIADRQLKSHVTNPSKKGTLIDTGLWKYSRHPNYFGESVVWWGIYLTSVSLGAPLWTVLSPILITLLVRYVSGVPMLEKRLTRYPGYETYVRKTSIFIPLPNKKGS